jgi:hypothetical protein
MGQLEPKKDSSHAPEALFLTHRLPCGRTVLVSVGGLVSARLWRARSLRWKLCRLLSRLQSKDPRLPKAMTQYNNSRVRFSWPREFGLRQSNGKSVDVKAAYIRREYADPVKELVWPEGHDRPIDLQDFPAGVLLTFYRKLKRHS